MNKNRQTRADGGYVNAFNKYGTTQDNSSAYRFQSGGIVPDITLTIHYESNGLFSKIIDAPAEEAIKHGFELNADTPQADELLREALDALDWEQKAATAIKWARLYGGAIIVMLIDDGGGIDEPLNRDAIRGIDGIKVFERTVVQPDWAAALYGEPQYYNVSSIGGHFTVHASRCLAFKNGVLPEQTLNSQYRFWGTPEYLRIKNELRECVTSHGLGVKLLDRSVQAIYAMKGLAELLGTEDGEAVLMKRLQAIDKARGVLNSIAIDNDGESYDFKSVTFSGVKEIIDATCNMLSAVTSIPQTILFGRSPAGMNATGQGDLENYYNLCERIQKMMLFGNLKTLSGVVFAAARAKGEIEETPKIKLKFNPLWSLSETEQAAVEQTRAVTSQTKAQTAQTYVDMGALDPSEVRKGLAEDKEFNIEKLLDDIPDGELLAGWEDENSLKPNEFSDTINSDEDCKAKDPSECRTHGNKSLSKEEIQRRKTISGVLSKATTSDGIKITSVRDHAFERMAERGYGASHVKNVIETVKPTDGKWKGSKIYEKDDLRVVVNEKSGEIISVIRVKKKGGNKN